MAIHSELSLAGKWDVMMAGLQVHLKAGCLVVLMEFLTVVMRVGQMAHLKVGYWEAMVAQSKAGYMTFQEVCSLEAPKAQSMAG